MNKEPAKKIYGVLGFPVKHSLSPAMHNAAFRALKINAEYHLFEVGPQQLEDFLLSLNEKNIYGLNITVPYKEKIIDFVTLNPDSFYLRQIKAVNTIIRQEDIWRGFNTDIPGFERHLRENFNPAKKKVAVLGAGGAARAVVYVLAHASVSEIRIFDIDQEKSENVCRMVRGIFPDFSISPVNSVAELEIGNKDLLVNATTVGLKDTDPCLVSEEMLHKNLFVYDLIYNPAQTKLLALAKQAGARIANGLGMLLYQGMLSFKIWTGKDASLEVMRSALEKELGNARND